MALELETIIMEEIGLGNHYNWYDGTDSCKEIRQEAAIKLPGAIRNHHQKGESIAEPDEGLCAAIVEISQVSDSSEYSLTKTWEAASYVIAEHIHQSNTTPPEREEAYGKMLKYLQEQYLRGTKKEAF